MSDSNRPSGMSRRQFLVKAGVATGAMATFPLQAHAGTLFGKRHRFTVGAVLPQSTLLPLLGENFLAGMQLRFAEAGLDGAHIVAADAGNSLSVAVDKAHSLIGADRVDILTGFFNPLLLPRLQGVLEQSGTLLINAEMGANLSTPGEDVASILHNSLGYWQANRTMGAWAASGMGKRAALVTSFYESGYDSAFAFRQGFEAAGGRVASSDVTHIPPTATDFPRLFAKIAATSPDFIHATYSGQAALDFVAAYAQSPLAGRIPLTAAGFTVDDGLLGAMGSAALGIRSCLPWSRELQTSANRGFCTAFARQSGREADAAALLGYDTAGMIAQAVSSAGRPERGSRPFARALQRATFTGPRGDCSIDPVTGNIDTPLYLREVRRERGAYRNVVIAELPRLSRSTSRADQLVAGVKTGWLETYLCV